MSRSIGFIGAGAMATAMACGQAGGKLFSTFIFSDVNDQALADIKKRIPECKTTKSNVQLVREADVIVFAVKPQYLKQATANLKGAIDSSKLVVSIMAGVSIKQLGEFVGSNLAIIRTMPNTPLLVRRGTTGMAVNQNVTAQQERLIFDAFSALGTCVKVEEHLLDALTGVSGSGPAFVCLLIEALADGGVLAGLPRPVALKLASSTVYGTGALISEKNIHPAVMKDMISSPAGTTIYGVRALEQGKFRGTVMKAVEDAAKRSSQLKSKV